MYDPWIISLVDVIYIINLPSRADRRIEIDEQLKQLGLSLSHPKIHLLPASRPIKPGGFPSIGAHGCFLSHLNVLKDALAKKHDAILILEDDADFTPFFISPSQDQLETLQKPENEMIYFGHRFSRKRSNPNSEHGINCLEPNIPVITSHAIMIKKNAISAAVDYFVELLSRPPGHEKGGPMHVDGAYSWFRRTHPDRKTLVTEKEWVVQRASRTDIHELRWKENIPFINTLRRVKNRFFKLNRT